MKGRCGSQKGDTISEGYKNKTGYKTATFMPDVWHHLVYQVSFKHICVHVSAIGIKCFYLWVCLCVHAFILGRRFTYVCLCACEVCVNRDRRRGVRTCPCIIHEADLAEESRGSSVLL